jgi:hypothetical protein
MFELFLNLAALVIQRLPAFLASVLAEVFRQYRASTQA